MKIHPETQYLRLLQSILDTGVDRENRTGIPTRALFQHSVRFNLADGFPVLTTKKVAFRLVVAELLWFIKGSRDVRVLNELGCHIWDANAYAPTWLPRAQFEGDAGRIYGVQWRGWRRPDGTEIDQLGDVVGRLSRGIDDRRLIVSAWNPSDLDEMSLPPCHMFYQLHLANGVLTLGMYQRSCDMFLGVPFNIASYALLLHMIAQVIGAKAGEVVIHLADAHIYHNHFEQAATQIAREPRAFPRLWLNPEVHDIESFTMDDIRLEDYDPHPPIKAVMAV